jgi:hypothetical protein
MAPHERSGLIVTFPEGTDYGIALGRLRKMTKEYLHVEIHRRPDGALIMGSPAILTSVLLILTHDFAVRWEGATDVQPTAL